VNSAQNCNIGDEKKSAKMSFTEDRTALLQQNYQTGNRMV
jgi:hypothetical protein